MTNPLEIHAQLVHEAVQECGPGATIATIVAAAKKRAGALPPDILDEIERAVKQLSSFSGPGFHEHGSH